jgi:hypothetical protein
MADMTLKTDDREESSGVNTAYTGSSHTLHKAAKPTLLANAQIPTSFIPQRALLAARQVG